MTAEQDDLDLAALIVEHTHPHCCIDGSEWAGEEDCLPYRLATLALDLQGKVTRHHEPHEYRQLNGKVPRCTCCGDEWVDLRWRCDNYRAPSTCLSVACTTPCDQCAVLDDQPEQEVTP